MNKLPRRRRRGQGQEGERSYGTIGAGSVGHFAMTQLGNQPGVEFVHVPYHGGGPLMNDALVRKESPRWRR